MTDADAPQYPPDDLEPDGSGSLADDPLNPVDDPAARLLTAIAKGVFALGVASVGMFVLMSVFVGSCIGATRSSKLKWQERQLEMNQAEHDAQSSAGQNR